MSITTTTLSLNPAFFQEIKEDNRELTGLLAELTEICRNGDHRLASLALLHSKLSELRDRLAIHFSLEEAYGYFEDALTAAPWLTERAEQLRSQHGELYLMICAIVDGADGLVHHEMPGRVAEVVKREFRDFARQLRKHESDESELINRAFQDDIGAMD